MRNLKRALSLALSTVMLLGMMVVGTSASYKDVSSKDNKEAIEVLQAAGIMTGDENGNFNPAKNVTRNEMAVVMANMLDLKVSDFNAAKTSFTDVPQWAAPYVAACKADGIIAGYSDTYFGGSDSVTAAQAALMMMKALGYFQVQSDFGDDWQLATVKQGSKIKLFDGVDAAAAAALTRNEVAQLALNALEATMVENTADSGNISIGDIVISNGSKYENVAPTEDNYDLDDTKNETLELAEYLYEGKLEKSTDVDAFGREATVWTWDTTKTIGVYANEADYTFVIDEATTVADLIDDNNLDKKITDAGEYGDDALAVGQVVELFVDDKALENVVVYEYALAEITDVTECDKDDDEDAIADGAEYVVEIDDEPYYDIQIPGFNAKTFVKDAKVVLTTQDGEAVVETKDFENLGDTDVMAADVAVADSVDGKVTAVSAKYFRIDGDKYVAADYSAALNDEGTFYLDPNGFVIGFAEDEDTVSLDDVVYVVDTFTKDSTSDYGKKSTTYYVQVMGLDGTVENLVYGIDNATGDDFGVTTAPEAGLYTYKTYSAKKVIDDVNYKGCSKLDSWTGDDDNYVGALTAGIELESDDTKAAASINGASQVRLNSKTNYILTDGTLGDLDVSVKVGGVNVDKVADSIVIATKTTGNYVAQYVILPETESGAASYDDVIYVDGDADYEGVTVADTDCVKFFAYDEKGEKVEITLAGSEVAESGFYTYTIDDDGIYELDGDIDALVKNDGTGIIETADYAGYYGTLMSVEGLADIETEGATFVDLHDTDVYSKTVKTLAAMDTAVEKGYTVELAVYADDGAVLIVVTNVAKVAE